MKQDEKQVKTVPELKPQNSGWAKQEPAAPSVSNTPPQKPVGSPGANPNQKVEYINEMRILDKQKANATATVNKTLNNN